VGDEKAGGRRRAVGTRDRVMSHLLMAGEVRDASGMASTALAEAIAYPGSSIAFAQLLSGMERSGLIEREIRGKRTYRITPVKAARAPARPGAAPPPTCCARTAAETDRSGFELSRRPQKILLGEINAGVPQDVVSRRDVKKELRNAERQQQRLSGKFSLGTILESESDFLVGGRFDLCARQALHEIDRHGYPRLELWDIRLGI